MHLWIAAAIALVADLPTGRIVDAVTCAADSSQSYALFLPRARLSGPGGAFKAGAAPF